MKPKRLEIKYKRICRPAGGLFMGIKFHFPCSIWDGDCEYTNYQGTNTTYTLAWAFIGLLAWEVEITYIYNIKPIKNTN